MVCAFYVYVPYKNPIIKLRPDYFKQIFKQEKFTIVSIQIRVTYVTLEYRNLESFQ